MFIDSGYQQIHAFVNQHMLTSTEFLLWREGMAVIDKKKKKEFYELQTQVVIGQTVIRAEKFL